MEQNDKRIVKNTLYLYIRMLIMMSLSFFSTRIVLNTLGVSDFGINNVVGGFVAMFTLLNSILQTGTRRFLALNLGKEDASLLKRTFSTAFVIHCIIAVLVVLLLETFGLWFLNAHLNIEPNRMLAANYVFQFSVVSLFLNITQTPFVAAVTAHEKFNIYAYLSIYDVVAKLAVLFILYVSPGDKLIVYAALIMGVNVLTIMLYCLYCIRQFDECKFSLTVDKTLFRQMCSFSGWSSLGHLSAVLNQQGTTVLLNIFFNTTVNAARGLAGTVLSVIEQFVMGFITASVPQLTKYYGAGEQEKFKKLIFNVSQYTLFLMSIIAIPVLLEIDFVLQLWLGIVPDYTAVFIKITIITYLLKYSNIMIDQGLTAIGRVKELSLITAPIYLLNVPLVYLALKIGFEPWSVYIVSMISVLTGFIVNLFLLSKYANFPAGEYFIKIFMRNLLLVAISSILPLYIHSIMPDGIARFCVVCSVSVLVTVIVVFYGGLNKDVQHGVKQKIVVVCKKIRYGRTYSI